MRKRTFSLTKNKSDLGHIGELNELARVELNILSNTF